MYNRAYKYRLYPNKSQEELLQKHFGSCRFVYNHFLEIKIKHYKETKETITWIDLANQLPKIKEEFEWLKEINAQTLQQSILNLDRAYTLFFRSGFRFPKFKSKKISKLSFIVPNGNNNTNIKLNNLNNKIILPKFREGIKCIFDREIPIDQKIKSATISQNKDEKYYVSVLVEIDKEFPTKPEPTKDKAIGLDFGVKTFITLNNGEKIENPKFMDKSYEKLKKHQQELELIPKDKATKHKSKKEQITKLYSKITRQKKDYLDKLSYKLTHDNQVDTICIEDLSIKKLQQINYSSSNYKMNDYAWGKFVNMLQYKGDWYGKNIRKIGEFDPSSKMCSNCGNINHSLTLDIREWKCSSCNTNHDRDVNAAINIVDFAFPKTKFKKDRNGPIEIDNLINC